MFSLPKLLLELFGPCLVVWAHYGPHILGTAADGGMWEHIFHHQRLEVTEQLLLSVQKLASLHSGLVAAP